MNKEKIIQSGKIASQVKIYARAIIKKDMPLLEIAEKIESKIIELGGKPAFPVNLSINNVAAHYTPSHDDETLSKGLLKVDLGVHIGGWVADTAFSLDLENSEENKKLIQASEDALGKAIKLVKNSLRTEKSNILTSEIGAVIQESIESFRLLPVINLCGHSIEQNNLHSGTSIPNVGDVNPIGLKPGLYAIEPFATTGSGKIRDGKPSGIYELKNTKNIRSQIAREILGFIIKEYGTLPFCSRWIVKKFGTRALLGLSELEKSGNLHQFSQLVEIKDSKVSQAEHTILITEKEVFVTTV